jgi:anthranilate/para-aminobenzoate synthase component II
MGSDEKSNFGKYVKRAPDLVKGSVSEQSEDGLGAYNRVNNQLDYVRRRYSAEYIRDMRLRSHFMYFLR